MKTVKIPTTLAFVLIFSGGALTQVNTNPPVGIPNDTRPEYKIYTDRDRARQNERVQRVVDQSRSVERRPGRRASPEEVKATEEEKRKALEEINRLLSVPSEYGVRYADFLKGKNTGLMRVFPDRGCDKGMVVTVASLERCGDTAPIRGAGSLFSFRLNELPSYLSLASIHFFIGQSDIHFVDGKFNVGTAMIQDIIADLGEVELAEITLKSKGVRYLRSFKPGDSVAKVALQNQELAKGVAENGFVYSRSASIKLNHTYVLRSIAHNPSRFKSFWHTDVITAFKVVGQEDDGSVILLWKELKESAAPFIRK